MQSRRAMPRGNVSPRWKYRGDRGQRGSVLLTAMLLAVIIAIGLASYLGLSRNSLKLAHRTFFSTDAGNLAEAGLEEAIYCFNQMSSGVPLSTAWIGWTVSGSTATRTLPTFNRDQNGIGVVKVFVSGYNGADAAPYAVSQATVSPFDGGAPVVKIVRCGLKNNTDYSMNGIVALNGLTFKGQTIADSFNSNPTNSPTGPWLQYSSTIARANTRVIVPAGTINLGNGMIYGNLLLGPAVTPPAASQVTGIIQTNFSGTFTMPPFPTAGSVSRSYNLGSTIPANLPVSGHSPASDGTYYYFCNGATITNTTIASGTNVAIVGTNTGMGSGLVLNGTGTCVAYIDGPVNCTGAVNNSSWAGALRIFTTTTANCTIGNNGQIVACLYAPNAALTASGGGNTGMLVGYFLAKTITATGHMDFHYDEALQGFSQGNPWQVTQWFEAQSAADRATLRTLTNNFLP